MSNPWGLPESKPSRPEPQATAHDAASAAQVSPARGAVKEGHRSIVRLHLVAIAVWLLIAGVVGGMWLIGRDVPGVLVPAGLFAAAGHTLFLSAHLYLASAMRPSRQGTKIESAGDNSAGDGPDGAVSEGDR